MNEAANAWVLPIAESVNVAIGDFEMIYIIPEWLRFNTVPHASVHCNRTLIWQGHVVPVFDIYRFIKPEASARDVKSTDGYFVCIVAYTDPEDEQLIRYGAVLLTALPYRTTVTDDLCCDYPQQDKNWSKISLSCFHHAGQRPIPIMNLQRIFASALA